MTTLEIFLLALVVGLVFCPPKWDPAIRLKEWLNRNSPEKALERDLQRKDP